MVSGAVFIVLLYDNLLMLARGTIKSRRHLCQGVHMLLKLLIAGSGQSGHLESQASCKT